MQIDQAGIDFIKQFEGLSLTAYADVAGKLTIGYGHLMDAGESYPEGITEEQAEQILAEDLVPAQNAVNAHMDPSCNQNQFNALCSFAFNLGAGSLQTMLSHGWDQVPTQLPRWDHAGGVAVAGLTRRREAEVTLFNS